MGGVHEPHPTSLHQQGERVSKETRARAANILGADAVAGSNNHQPASKETTQAQGLSHLPLGEKQEGSTKREADIHPNPQRSKEPWHH